MSEQRVTSYDDVSGISENVVHLRETPGSIMVRSSISFTGTGNVLFVEDGTKLQGTRLRFLGDNSVIHIRRSTRNIQVVASVFTDSVLYLGPQASFTSEARFLASERKHIVIGADAMFSSRVAVRTADPHLIHSVDTHERINPSASVWIGDHVWLGEDTLFLKGARVGSGSIVAARAVVTKKLPSNNTLAGVGARSVARGVFWRRPSVHAWTVEQTAAGHHHAGSEFIYERDGEVLDVAALEADLEMRSDGSARADWCRQLDTNRGKNRFFVGEG